MPAQPIVLRQGAYDLTALDGMENAFPPRRTTNNIYRGDDGYSKQGAAGGEARDSLDRLAVSSSNRRRLSRLVRTRAW